MLTAPKDNILMQLQGLVLSVEEIRNTTALPVGADAFKE